MNNLRPTFGVNSNKLVNSDQQKPREELGCIWSRTSSKTNTQFFSIRMSLTKDMLKKLLDNPEDKVSIDLVAFPNKFKEGKENRPAYRIYEEKKL